MCVWRVCVGYWPLTTTSTINVLDKLTSKFHWITTTDLLPMSFLLLLTFILCSTNQPELHLPIDIRSYSQFKMVSLLSISGRGKGSPYFAIFLPLLIHWHVLLHTPSLCLHQTSWHLVTLQYVGHVVESGFLHLFRISRCYFARYLDDLLPYFLQGLGLIGESFPHSFLCASYHLVPINAKPSFIAWSMKMNLGPLNICLWLVSSLLSFVNKEPNHHSLLGLWKCIWAP